MTFSLLKEIKLTNFPDQPGTSAILGRGREQRNCFNTYTKKRTREFALGGEANSQKSVDLKRLVRDVFSIKGIWDFFCSAVCFDLLPKCSFSVHSLQIITT